MFGWLLAALSLPASCSPYRAMHPGWGETAGFSCPAIPLHQPTRAPAPHKSQHCCFASASGPKDTPACWSFKQHGTSSVRRPTLHSWHLSQSSSLLSHLENRHFESLKSCLLTLILTSSPLRRTQPEESKTNPRYLHLTSESKEKRAFIN